MSGGGGRCDAVPMDFPVERSFALLLILTADGKTFIRPVCGEWANGINDAVGETKEIFPGCRMKIFEENYGAWKKYFVPNGVPKEDVLM